MLNQQDVPVFWDGGFWYAVPTEEPKPDHVRPAAFPPRWTGTYGAIGGTFYALIRSPDLWLQAPVVPVTQEQILTAAKAQGYCDPTIPGKRWQRIGGL